jgi:hypothetical protein
VVTSANLKRVKRDVMNRWLVLTECSSGRDVIINMSMVQMVTQDPETTLWFHDSGTVSVRESLGQLELLLDATGRSKVLVAAPASAETGSDPRVRKTARVLQLRSRH